MTRNRSEPPIEKIYARYLDAHPDAKRVDDLSKTLWPVGVAVFVASIFWGFVGGFLIRGSFWPGVIGPLVLSLVGGVLIAFRFIVLGLGEYQAWIEFRRK